MLLGTDKTNITPLHPVELAGFSHRDGKTSEVFEPLYVKTFLLKQVDTDFLFVVADLIWWDSKIVDQLKKLIKEECNIPAHHICFHATHNHSGPQTSRRFSEKLGVPSLPYLAFLRKQVLLSVKNAQSNLVYVTPYIHRGKSDLGVNRRKKGKTHIEMKPNYNGSVDNDLTVISFLKDDDTTHAIWIHYACHPTTTDKNIISSEFPGICCNKLEENYPGCNVAYFQGFCGDIRPGLIKGDRFYRGEIKDMLQVAARFLKDVHDVIHMKSQLCTVSSFNIQEIKIPLSFDPSAIDHIPKELEKEWELLVKRINGDYELYVQYIQIGDQLSFISCNAEFVHAYGHFIKKRNNTILPLGYSNGMVGYICTETQLAEGGYEAEESVFYFGYPAKLSVFMQQQIEQKLELLIRRR